MSVIFNLTEDDAKCGINIVNVIILINKDN